MTAFGMGRSFFIFLALFFALRLHAGELAKSNVPKMSELVKSTILARVVDDREVMSHAQLKDTAEPGLKHYSYYAIMLVRAPLGLVRRVMVNYKLYSEMVPYIDKTQYSPQTRILQIEGGIWKYKLVSSVLFEEKGEQWIHYSIIAGHFKGLVGDLYFESAGEKGTLVYMRGEIFGAAWPPAFIIERGAEIVFGFTGKRMRSYIESQKKGEDSHDPKVPQPRRHFPGR